MDVGRGMRWLLLCCGPMNLAGAVCFAPPVTAVRRLFGLPESAPFYLWVLSAWILAFGVAYVVQGWTGRADRGVLALGAWGKGVFAGLLVGLGIVLLSAAPLAIRGNLSDLAAYALLAWLILCLVAGTAYGARIGIRRQSQRR